MSVLDIFNLITSILTLIAIIGGAIAATFIFFQFAPLLHLRITPSWPRATQDILVLRFEIENKARVRVYNPRVRIQLLEHDPCAAINLSQFVPFSKEMIIPTEIPLHWNEPDELFRAHKRIYPGEIITVERLYHYPQDRLILHIGLQAEVDLGVFGRMVTRNKKWRQTSTCFVVK